MGDNHHFKIKNSWQPMKQGREQAKMPIFLSFGERWRGWFLWTLFWREREGGWSQWVASHLNDSWLKSVSENYKIVWALFGDYTKRKWRNLDFLSFFFLPSDIEYAICTQHHHTLSWKFCPKLELSQLVNVGKKEVFLLFYFGIVQHIKKIMMDQSNWLLAKIKFEPLRDTSQLINAN